MRSGSQDGSVDIWGQYVIWVNQIGCWLILLLIISLTGVSYLKKSV